MAIGTGIIAFDRAADIETDLDRDIDFIPQERPSGASTW
jgi:hypothetical protein